MGGGGGGLQSNILDSIFISGNKTISTESTKKEVGRESKGSYSADKERTTPITTKEGIFYFYTQV